MRRTGESRIRLGATAVAASERPGCRAVIFDFNGTLSDDEPILYRVYAEIFAEQGRPLSHRQYVDQLAGLSDEEIMRGWLGDRDDIDRLVTERVDRYCAVCDGATITPQMRGAVRYAAERVPLAIVSGASAVEIDAVVKAAELDDAFSVIVTSDAVSNGKPNPDGYRVALDALGLHVTGLHPGEVTAFEDTEAGVVAAKAASLRCIGVLGTVPRARLAQADEIVGAIDERLLQRLLG